MGICYEAIDMLAFLKQKGMMNHISSVLELGNQHVRYHRIDVIEKLRELKIDIKPNYSTSTFYKQWGIEHYTAIDLNGLEGALKFDLNTLFTKDGLFSKEYDLVTNFGTTEHCFNQATAFENIHNLTKKGGYILHLLPAHGWNNHCFYRYDTNFFEDIADKCGYEILSLYYYTRKLTWKNYCKILKKKSTF